MYISLCAPYSVILNGVKNLEVSVAVDDSTSLEILRYTQDDIDRRHDDTTLCHSEHHTPVILNEVKNLEVSVAVDDSTSLEILRYTQDDIISNVALRVSLHRADLPTPENHKVTKSQSHRGWG